MPLNNTLELAKQGDPAAISTILSYHLTQRYNVVASVIRLGDYLSVFVEADFTPEQTTSVDLICAILQDLGIGGIKTIEIHGRQATDPGEIWSQTIQAHHLLSDRASIMHQDTLTTEITTTVYPPPQVEQADKLTPDAEDSGFALQALLQRPEMVAVLVFAITLALWEMYVAEERAIAANQPLSGRKLAHRLGVHHSTLSRYKLRPNFPTWSQDLDPDGLSWSYNGTAFVAKLAEPV
jgi:hypothetical protein